jgi:hypothetical protein
MSRKKEIVTRRKTTFSLATCVVGKDNYYTNSMEDMRKT